MVVGASPFAATRPADARDGASGQLGHRRAHHRGGVVLADGADVRPAPMVGGTGGRWPTWTQGPPRRTFFASLPAHLHEMPLRQAKAHPDRPALTDEARSLAYAELGREIEATAARLQAHGVRPGDRVALIPPRTPWRYAVLIFALSACGAVVSPVNARIAPREVAVMRDALQPRCTIYVCMPATPRAAMPKGPMNRNRRSGHRGLFARPRQRRRPAKTGPGATALW